MIDLHTHTLWSDGELVPAEHVRRAIIAGYEAIAITDHCDSSNIEELCKEGVKFSETMNKVESGIIVLCGIELTHVMPAEIKDMTAYARGHGIQIVVVHGETIVEPVRQGTNRAAIDAKVNILAHPGLIDPEDVKEAAKNGVYLEITAKRGHSLTNGLVAKLAEEHRANMVIDTDAHVHTDFISREMAEKVLAGCGMDRGNFKQIFQNSRDIVKKIMNR
jgi:putative hydrolase